jgi:hypothetical protein
MSARWPYGAVVALAATLSFAIEPMAGKALQPALGGVPAVWTTCLLFFQLALLGGYFAQFALVRIAHEGARLAAHATLLAVPLALSRFDLIERAHLAARERSPVLGALLFLSMTVGAPFVALSTVAPAVQRFFTRATGEPPWPLYAASNAGSAAGLLVYPLVVERAFSLSAQAIALRVAYALVAAWVLALGVRALRAPPPIEREASDREARADNEALESQGVPASPSTDGARDPWGWWLTLAAVPSALLATTSAAIASDLPGIPLLWVTPLAVYLCTFVLAFGRSRPAPTWVARVLTALALVMIPLTVRRTSSPYALLLALHLGYLGLASFACHARLAAMAPRAARLERFYLAIALGGAVGTLLFGVLPARILPDLWEAPACIALGCLARVHRRGASEQRAAPEEDAPSTGGLPRVRVIAPLAWLGLLAVVVRARGITLSLPWIAAGYGPAVLLAGASSARPGAYVLALLAFATGGAVFESASAGVLSRGRSFFGTTLVQAPPGSDLHVLVHGTTVHGTEHQAQRGRCVPRAYYRREGPFGRVMAARHGAFSDRSVLAVGLGAGSIVCFARPAERWTFVEIDPDVVRVARDRRLFTFLSDNPLGGAQEVLVGDGRLALRAQPPGARDVIIMDAFNSDSVPLHLMTREALAIDLHALAPRGWLVMHISNRALDLPRALSALVRDAGLSARVNADATEFTGRGRIPTWAVLARTASDLAPLGAGWVPLPDPRGLAPFTDGHASVVPIIQW